MLFCEEIFHYLELEESLYFTATDIDFHSFGKDQEINEEELRKINCRNLSTGLTVNLE